MIWESRLRTAEDLEAEAAKLERALARAGQSTSFLMTPLMTPLDVVT
jgi:hypothetical protein